MREHTSRLRLLPAVAAVLLIGGGAVQAQTSDLPPERAPAPQQFAPPARIAPPMNAGEQKPGARPETTGQTPQRLRPGRDENIRPSPDRPDMKKDGAADLHAGDAPAQDAHGNGAQPRRVP